MNFMGDQANGDEEWLKAVPFRKASFSAAC